MQLLYPFTFYIRTDIGQTVQVFRQFDGIQRFKQHHYNKCHCYAQFSPQAQASRTGRHRGQSPMGFFTFFCSLPRGKNALCSPVSHTERLKAAFSKTKVAVTQSISYQIRIVPLEGWPLYLALLFPAPSQRITRP